MRRGGYVPPKISVKDSLTEIVNRGCDGFIQKPFGMKEMSDKLS
jgi:hypothetical protein